LRQHRFSWLTTGDLGWIHQSNMVLVGVLTVLLAVGVHQMMRTGRGAVWGPRLLGLFGVAYIIGGVLTADPVAGFPPGTTPEMVQTTWHGVVQNASRGASRYLSPTWFRAVWPGHPATSFRRMTVRRGPHPPFGAPSAPLELG